MPELPDLSRYVKNPLLRAALARLIDDYAGAVVVAAMGGGEEGVPRGVVLGLAERVYAAHEVLARLAERREHRGGDRG